MIRAGNDLAGGPRRLVTVVWTLLTGLALFLGLAPFSGHSADTLVVGDFSQGLDAEGAPRNWQLKEKVGQADFSLVREEGLHALWLKSVSTSFSFQREVKVDIKEFPYLTWKWKATKLPTGGDFRKSKTDDQAAQLFLAFSKTKTIVYIWDTTAPQGMMGDANAPPFMSIKVVVVRSGPGDTGKWITETRNVWEDYRKLYGDTDKPVTVSGMRLQVNSQHTKSAGEAGFADVVFRRNAGERASAENPAR
jgi:hypothetical protein